MNLKHLATAAAATALLGGAAYAQTDATAQPDATPAQSQAGSTSMPSGQVNAPSASAPTGTSADTSTAVPGSAADTAAAPAASSMGTNASATVSTQVVTNGPVPDTPENRAKYGAPMSRAGKLTKAAGN